MDFIHRFISGQETPPGRTLLLLHGTGGDENDMIPLGRDLDPAAGLLSPRGKVLENGMPRFFRRLAEGIFDEEDVIRRAHELADFVVGAAARYEFDLRRVTAVGYSNGANIAAAMLVLRPEVVASAVLFRAMVPLVPSAAPDLSQTRVLLSSASMTRLCLRKMPTGLRRCCGMLARTSRCVSNRPGMPSRSATSKRRQGGSLRAAKRSAGSALKMPRCRGQTSSQKARGAAAKQRSGCAQLLGALQRSGREG